MIVKQFRVGEFEITLYEYPENKKLMYRNIYTLGVRGKGTFIYEVSDKKEEAMQVYKKVIMYIEESHFKDEITLNDIVEHLK